MQPDSFLTAVLASRTAEPSWIVTFPVGGSATRGSGGGVEVSTGRARGRNSVRALCCDLLGASCLVFSVPVWKRVCLAGD